MKRLVAFLAVAGVLLAGCAAIPSSGPVTKGDVIADQSNPRVDFLPSGPRAGATPEEIVEDFLQAETSPLANYEIAREYLANNVRQTWDPDFQVTIRDGEMPAPIPGNNGFSFHFPASATVDAKGVYKGEAFPATLDFQFVKQDGEWRISKLDNGIVLSADNFQVVFVEQPVYFFDPTFGYLVPDVRWFPQTPQLATRVASALVAGPSDLLKGAVVTAFPTGTTLSGLGLVTIDSGTATVDLSDVATSATDEQRARMQQQLKESLNSLATVTNVALTVGGIALKVSDATSVPARAQPDVGALPLVLSGGVFGFASSGGVTPAEGVAGPVQNLRPTSITYAGGSGTAAVLTRGGGLYRITRTGQTKQLASGAALLPPSIDPQGFVWTGSSTSATSIVAYGKDDVAHPITVTGLTDSDKLTAFELSRDGARALLVVTNAVGTRVLVAGVIRQDGVPQKLGSPVALASGIEAPSDATWVDESTVATLTQVGQSSEITSYDLGGPSESLGLATDGVRVVGGNAGVDGLRVLDGKGELLRLRSASWQTTGITAEVIATQEPG